MCVVYVTCVTVCVVCVTVCVVCVTVECADIINACMVFWIDPESATVSGAAEGAITFFLPLSLFSSASPTYQYPLK